MKRIFLLCTLVVLLAGCTSIQNSDLDSLIHNTIQSAVKTMNVNREGYRYYLPKGLNIKNHTSYNEVFQDDKYQYYMYVDVVSYHNKTDFRYTVNEEAFFSRNIDYNEKKGYVEINNYKNNQYLIEIMYNYAKIEVIVYDKDIELAVTYAMVVLNSVTYNDNVIAKNLMNSTFEGMEESFRIFEVIGSNNYIEFTQETSSGDQSNDPDYIN